MLCLFLANQAVSQKIEYNQNLTPMDSSYTNSGLVCKLTGPELAQRLEQLKLEIFAEVKQTEEVENGFVFHFADDNDFVLKLIDYILTERSCCPFFKFDLTFQPNRGGIALKISGPIEAKEMVQMFTEDE